jgi:hypothetical protein
MSMIDDGLFWFMGLSGLVLSISFPILEVLTMTLLQTIVPVKMQGRVNSVVISLAHAAQPLGMALSSLASIMRTADLFLGCSIVGILVVSYGSRETAMVEVDILLQIVFWGLFSLWLSMLVDRGAGFAVAFGGAGSRPAWTASRN